MGGNHQRRELPKIVCCEIFSRDAASSGVCPIIRVAIPRRKFGLSRVQGAGSIKPGLIKTVQGYGVAGKREDIYQELVIEVFGHQFSESQNGKVHPEFVDGLFQNISAITTGRNQRFGAHRIKLLLLGPK